MAGKYQRIIEYVFEKKAEELDQTVENPFEEDIPFHRDDLEDAMDELDIEVGNVPDIPYAYRSRRPLPDSIGQYGYSAIILDDNRPGESPTYLFTKQDQLIPIPEEVDETRKTSTEALPEPVRKYIGEDEQGVLTQVRYAGILDEFTGFTTYHLTSHLRFRVRGREAELDDLYIGEDEERVYYAITVEAKGKGEKLNRNQIIRNTRGIENKKEYPESVRSLAVKLDDKGYIYLFEFNVFTQDGEDQVGTERVWKYTFESEQ